VIKEKDAKKLHTLYGVFYLVERTTPKTNIFVYSNVLLIDVLS
jgi:hypothetical protein